MQDHDRETAAAGTDISRGAARAGTAGRGAADPGGDGPAAPPTVRECLADDTGATTAEYAITTLAACGFAALLVVVLKSDPLKEMISGVITGALGLGG